MELTRSTQQDVRSVREVFHVVMLPWSSLVSGAVLTLLETCDRERWYPSMLVEGHDSDREQEALAQAARGLGVPVMSPRTRRGEVFGGRIRTFLDEWFYVRNAYASLLHLHAQSPVSRGAPANWLKFVMPHLPCIDFVYGASGGNDKPGLVQIHSTGLPTGTRISLSSMGDGQTVNHLYEIALRAPDRKRCQMASGGDRYPS